MAKLVLDENYLVEMDTHNFTLKYSKKAYDEVKKKEVTTSKEWNYPTLKGALNVYMNECIKPLESIEKLYSELSRIEKLITLIKN